VFKVLQISNKAPFPANDGSSIAIYNMAKGLIDNKVNLHLLTINTKKHFKADEMVPQDFRESSNYLSVYKNTNTSFFGAFLNLFSSGSYFVSRFYFKAFENKLIETLKKKSFDIIQLEGLFMGVYIKTIKKYSKAKIVLRAHNVEHQIWSRHIANESFSLKKIYLTLQNNRLKKFELKVLCEVNAVVTITDRDKKEFIDLGFKKPIFTCITGVDVKSYRIPHELNQRAKTIFYFGSMDWLPNQEAANWFLNNCWDKIHKAVPEAKFIIAGRGMPLEFFHITRPNVLIIENVENGQAFYQQHEIMVVPLWSGSGLRIKIIEGMAYGKAIVSTSIGAEGIPFTDGKNIIIADTADSFSNAVINLLLNDFKKKELEKNASELALNEFDNFKVISKLNEFYKELLHA
jgi:glycosyltransferase involved in cell wall biosynthesis